MKRLRMILMVALLAAIILRLARPRMITQALGEGMLVLIPKIIGMFV